MLARQQQQKIQSPDVESANSHTAISSIFPHRKRRHHITISRPTKQVYIIPSSSSLTYFSMSASDAARPQQRSRPAFRRYRWDTLSDAERDAIRDCISVGVSRSGIGLCSALAVTGILSTLRARRGLPRLPPLLRYGSATAFAAVGTYAGFMSAGPLYTRRILAVPNSKVADDLRTAMSDWHSRHEIPLTESVPSDPLPEGDVGSGVGRNEIEARDPKVVRAEERAQLDQAKQLEQGKQNQRQKQKQKQNVPWTDRIGLTNSETESNRSK